MHAWRIWEAVGQTAADALWEVTLRFHQTPLSSPGLAAAVSPSLMGFTADFES